MGSWNNGAKYKWMNLIAVAEIVIVSLYLMMPFVPGAVPFSDDFSWKFVNYAPIVTVGALLHPDDLVEDLGQALVHRAEAHHRRGRGRGLRRADLRVRRRSSQRAALTPVWCPPVRFGRIGHETRYGATARRTTTRRQQMTTPDEPLNDDEMDTTAGGTDAVPAGDADGTDGGDADGTDGSDGDSTDSTDGDPTGDADGTTWRDG